MKTSLFARIVGSLGLAALAACGSQSTLPATQGQLALRASAGAACDIKGFWFFRDGCAAFDVRASGLSFAIPAFAGIRIEIQLAKNNATEKLPFIAADGTDDKNITGTLQGHVFPVYGSTKCVNLEGAFTPCRGKAVVYFVILNLSTQTVTFQRLPAIAVSASKFPGKTCRIDVLNTSFDWTLLPVTVAPSNGKVTFPSSSGSSTVGGRSGHVYALTCQ